MSGGAGSAADGAGKAATGTEKASRSAETRVGGVDSAEAGVEAKLGRVEGARSGDMLSEWEADADRKRQRIRFPARRFLEDAYPSMGPESQLSAEEREARAREQDLAWRLRYARMLLSPRTDRWRGGQATEQGRWRSTPGLVGLLNLGNTCWLNSVLQLLVHTGPLRRLLCSGDVAADCRAGATLPAALAALSHAAWTAKMVEEHPPIRLDPAPVYKSVAAKLGVPGDGEQQDAAEMLVRTLDELAEQTNLRGGGGREEPELVWELSLPEQWDVARETEARRNSSPMEPVFQSWELSETRCGGCRRRGVSFAPQRLLCLPIPEGPAPSLQDCLRAYFGGEALAEFRCPSCRRPRPAHKRLFLLRPPAVLLLSLKRFSGAPQPRRLNTPVVVPRRLALRELNLAHPELPLPAEGGEYSLLGLVAHHGGLAFGHYTAAVELEDGRWAELDDASFGLLSADQRDRLLRSHSPYILAYRADHQPLN